LVWGAGMSFQKCHAELNVPYDPYLDNVFDGEETSRGIRFFTHGYDVYTPDKVLVTHDYEGHQSNPVIHSWGGRKKMGNAQGNEVDTARKEKFDSVDWSFLQHLTDMKETVNPRGVLRINILMGLNDTRYAHYSDDPTVIRQIKEGRFGLGQARTLDQAYEFAGFSPVDKKMHKNRCGNNQWVPFRDDHDFNEDNDWGVNINLQRRIWNEPEPLLPPPNGAEEIKSRNLIPMGGDTTSTTTTSHVHSALTHGPNYHAFGWVVMLAMLLGGMIQRSRFGKAKKDAKSLN